MCPNISISDSVAANATETQLAGNQFEFLDRPAVINAGFAQSAAGLLISVYANGRVLAKDLVPVVKATTPLFPDDFLINDEVVDAGERLIEDARNTTGGALTLLSVFRIDYLA